MQYKIKNKVRLIELFAGIGAQAMALRDLGIDFEHYKVIEFDQNPLTSYNAIHNTNFSTIDIKEFDGKDLDIVDKDNYTYIMTYSFPCTSLSTAGKQQGMKKGSNTSSSLLWEVERLLNETANKPQILLMENVQQVLNKKNLPDFQEWQNFLNSLGYSNFVKVLDGTDFDVPQMRKRCFMVSILGDYEYEFPKSLPLSKTVTDILDTDIPEQYYLERNSKLGGRFYQQAYETLDNNVCSYGDIINSYNKTVNKSGIFNTLTTRPESCKTGLIIVTPEHTLRKLTPKETWRIMGFSDSDYYKAEKVMLGKPMPLYKQAGNSIIKPVLMAIFKEFF